MILDDIVRSAKARVSEEKRKTAFKDMRDAALSMDRLNGSPFKKALGKPGISFICEVKKASPSKGVISSDFPFIDIARGYERAGADAVSVLTEPEFFLGCDLHLEAISKRIGLPVLRKDFVVDSYQVYQARTIGASAVLLICSVLSDRSLAECMAAAEDLGISVLTEVHDPGEVERALNAGADIIGANNRDLRTFEVDIGVSVRLRDEVPDGVLFVAESGIRTRADIEILEKCGADAVLIGESMMLSDDKKGYLDSLRGTV
ncbi:MAG: indole-3-glycerol phosphate synthase TrpC [Candidatus Methanoplasma sp.]|jgi:indole-3-glycerol phosphate synthase|nr:indole-3-glycerol phosphate synthase TrpC [Candidatus Methanoplasma sp.]